MSEEPVIAYVVVHDQTKNEMAGPTRDLAAARAARNQLRAQAAKRGELKARATYRIEERAYYRAVHRAGTSNQTEYKP